MNAPHLDVSGPNSTPPITMAVTAATVAATTTTTIAAAALFILSRIPTWAWFVLVVAIVIVGY